MQRQVAGGPDKNQQTNDLLLFLPTVCDFPSLFCTKDQQMMRNDMISWDFFSIVISTKTSASGEVEAS